MKITERRAAVKTGLCKRFSAKPVFAAALFIAFFRGSTAWWSIKLVKVKGVSLSAAARSAAALVKDKLTPNCHLTVLVVVLMERICLPGSVEYVRVGQHLSA